MAFNNLEHYGIDASDMRLWATSNSARAFVAEIQEQRGLVFKRLLKDGEKRHSENAEAYKAFEKVLRLIEAASKVK